MNAITDAPRGSLAGPQSVCLSMVAKDEAHVIRRCLASVRPFLASWAVVDTGSTDGTQDVIRETMADLPGQLIERPWVDDFAHSRNQALDLARESGAEYALIFDADDEIEPTGSELPPLPAFGGLAAALLEVLPSGEERPKWNNFVPLDSRFHWVGVVHERLAHPGGVPSEFGALTDYRARVRHDGAASLAGMEKKELHYLEMLRAQSDWTSRLVLAEALSRRGDWAGALDASTDAGPLIPLENPDELYHCMLLGAVARATLRHATLDVARDFLRARDFRPERAEAPRYLSLMLRARGERLDLADELDRLADVLPLPKAQFLDASAYRQAAPAEASP